jgi:NRPS condensation-like uncharacterized protein
MDKFPITNERLYLRSPSIHVCFRAVIGGTFDENKIEEAVKNVCVRHPFLNSSVEIDNDNNVWLVQNKNSIGIEYYNSKEMDWQTWYKESDAVPFDFYQGPLVKFCVINGKNTEIIILGHHIIGDGIGYLNVVKDLLLLLDNRIDVIPQIPPSKPTDRYFKETVLLEQPTRDYAHWLNEEWRKNRTRFSEEDYQVFFEQYRKQYAPNLYMASLEGNKVKELLEKSKLNGLTVNELIASIFSIVLMEKLDRKEIRLGVAVNIRDELVSEPCNCMGNYVSGISVKVNIEPANDFISNAKNIASITREQLWNTKNRHLVVHFLNEFDKDLIESTMFAAYGNFDNSVSRRLAELIGEQLENKGLGISNLGRHNFDNYENIKIMDVQFIGPAFPANLLTVGVITANDKVNLCLRYNEGEIETNIIKTIYEKAIELLK